MLASVRFNKPIILGICCTVIVVICIYSYSSGGPAETSYGRYFGLSLSTIPSHVSLQSLLLAGISAAEKGGDVVRKIRESNKLSEKSKGKTKEGANDPLTAGDVGSHRVMYHGLSEAFPGVYIISEERDPEPSDGVTYLKNLVPESVAGVALDDVTVPRQRITVWIDPLDATQEYTENLLEYVTTMVCIAVDGRPVIGIIHKPFMNKTAWAWVGHQISPLLKTVTETKREHPVIIVSRSHAGKVQTIAKDALGESAEIVPAGGAGYKVLEVVAGRADVYVHSTLIKKWDICAGNAILNALGGRMTTLAGKDIFYGKNDPVKAEDGVLATITGHDRYVKKFEKLRHRENA